MKTARPDKHCTTMEETQEERHQTRRKEKERTVGEESKMLKKKTVQTKRSYTHSHTWKGLSLFVKVISVHSLLHTKIIEKQPGPHKVK